MDRLSQLKCNPFHFNKNIALSGNNINLDTSFNTNTINCDYYLPNEFKNEAKNVIGEEKFSLIHLNIRSIANKFDSF